MPNPYDVALISLKEEVKELEENIESCEEEIEDYKHIVLCFLEVFRRSKQSQVTFFNILQERSKDEKELDKFVKMIGAQEMYNDVKFIDNNFNN